MSETRIRTCPACSGRGWLPPDGTTAEQIESERAAALRTPTPGMAARLARIEAERAARREAS